MTIYEKLRDIEEESKRNQTRIDEYLGRRGFVISATGTITEAGRTVGQIQLVTDEDGGRIAQLYNAKGIYLCDCPFDGDDDKGYEIGMGIYRGYVAGWMNCELSIGRAVNQALYGKKDMELG